MAKIEEFIILSDYRDEPTGLDELALSIENDGLYQPIIVKPYEGPEENVKYEIIAGRRRFRAMSQFLGWKNLKKNDHYIVKEGCDALIAQFQENFNRQDFTPAEIASLISDIHKRQVEIHGPAIKGQASGNGWGMKDTGKLIGRDSSFISRMLSMAEHLDVIKDCKSVTKAMEIISKQKAKSIQTTIRKAQYEVETEIALAVAEDRTIEKYIENFKQETAEEFLSSQKEESVDLILTDPPYAINFDKLNTTKEYDSYVDDPEIVKKQLKAAIKEYYRILKNDKYCIIFTAVEWFSWLRETMVAEGFKCAATPIFWVKMNSTGKSMNPAMTLGSQCEIAVYGWKGVPELAQKGAGNVFPVEIVRKNRIHVAQKPDLLLEHIIKTFSYKGDIVLDSYCGSLSTMRAAYKTDRGFCGCEALQKNYISAVNYTREWAKNL